MKHDNKQAMQTQKAKSGRNSTQVGHDYVNQTSINISLWISLLVIVIVALGSYVAFRTDGLGSFFPSNPQNGEINPKN